MIDVECHEVYALRRVEQLLTTAQPATFLEIMDSEMHDGAIETAMTANQGENLAVRASRT